MQTTTETDVGGNRPLDDALGIAMGRVIVFAIVLALCAVSALPVVSANTSARSDRVSMVQSVSGDLIMETIQALEGFGTRAFALPSSEDVAMYIMDAFLDIGLEAELQWFAAGDYGVANVVAWIDGDDEDAPQLLVGAHYDSENQNASNLTEAASMPAPGADDDASGVASVLEAARVLSQSKLKTTVKFVAFGAEETGFDGSGGLVGSRYFAFSEAESGVRYRGTAVLDMIGYRDGDTNAATIVTNRDNDPFAKAVEGATTDHGLDLDLSVMVKPDIKYSDHASFWYADYPCMLVTEKLDNDRYFPINPYYHSELDSSDKLSIDQIVEVTRAVLGGLLELAEADELPVGTIALAGVVASASGGVVVYALLRQRKREET